DTSLLMDLDLAVLGDEPERYEEYARRIRLEYSMYPDIVYNKGRRKVLEHFLSMGRIYQTKPFFESREVQARRNLREELNSLWGGEVGLRPDGNGSSMNLDF